MPWDQRVLELFLEDWEYIMSEEDIKRKIAKVVLASRRTLNPSFRAYWKDTAKAMATKYNVNLSEIEKCPEYYDEAKTSRYH